MPFPHLSGVLGHRYFEHCLGHVHCDRRRIHRTPPSKAILDARRLWEESLPSLKATVSRTRRSIGPSAAASSVHSALFEVELTLEIAQHLVVDLALGAKAQRLALRIDDRSSDLAVLDEFAIFPVARGCIALAFDVFGAVPVDLAQLVEQRVMPWPDWIQLIDAPRGRFEQPLSRSPFSFSESDVLAEAKRPDEPRQRQPLPQGTGWPAHGATARALFQSRAVDPYQLIRPGFAHPHASQIAR
jgi:hypothetical protein